MLRGKYLKNHEQIFGEAQPIRNRAEVF